MVKINESLAVKRAKRIGKGTLKTPLGTALFAAEVLYT